jgi:predicted nuclease with RNAse H fold
MDETTIGIDLSAQPARTACCVLVWEPSSARIVRLGAGYDNPAIEELVSIYRPAKVAIDAPFGWPVAFTRAISEFTTFGRWPDTDDQRALLFRATDLFVRETTGSDPLSVSTNLIAICAMRCARLLILLTADAPLDRTGSGLVAEVYPAAALRQWGLDARGYKGAKEDRREKRGALVEAIVQGTASWLKLEPSTLELLRASDHLLDALIAAIVGRAVSIELALPIPEDRLSAAKAEGWIHLPARGRLGAFSPF